MVLPIRMGGVDWGKLDARAGNLEHKRNHVLCIEMGSKISIVLVAHSWENEADHLSEKGR